MRAYEFITESVSEKLSARSKQAPFATYVIPELSNQVSLLQYRFSVAIAGAKGAEKRKLDGVSSMSREVVW